MFEVKKLSLRRVSIILASISLIASFAYAEAIITVNQGGIKQTTDYVSKHDIKTSFRENGYFEIPNYLVSKAQYLDLYASFDQVIDLIAHDSSLSAKLLDIEQQFLSTSRAKSFAGAPSGYRDCSKIIGKKDSKQYFQYSSEYHNYLKKNHSNLLKHYPHVAKFLDKFANIDKAARAIISSSVDSLEHTDPYVRDALYKSQADLTLIMKVLRYDVGRDLSTSPHYDKSGLTLILDNDDKQDKKLVLAPHMQSFEFAKLSQPLRKFEGQPLVTSALLLPGACLEQLGLNIFPTPHAVLPATEQPRHATIAFALVPNMKTDSIQTTLADKENLWKRMSPQR